MELSRLLRRGLFVVATAVAGWLFTVLFAGNASAEEAPDVSGITATTQSQSGGGLLGGLLSGVTDTLGAVTGTVVDTTVGATSSLLTPAPPPTAPEPVLDLPELLPSLDGSAGDATTGTTPAEPRVATPVVPAPAVAPPPVVAPAPAPAVPPAPPALQPAPIARVDNGVSTNQHADHGDPEPRPAKAPATPAGPAPTAAPSHDNPGAGRGTHGVLPAHATLHPADAGFTTRSRAVDAAGRVAGLPASSPD